MYIRGMQGLGDNFYQHPIIRYFTEVKKMEVILETPWPELYADLSGVRFVRPDTNLRTQNKNMERSRAYYEKRPLSEGIRLCYVKGQKRDEPLYKALCDSVGVPQYYYLLCKREACKSRQRIAVVRPATVRKEWQAPSRNCKQEYIQESIDHLKQKGIKVYLVANIVPSVEDYVDFLPTGADVVLTEGQLNTIELMTLVWQASIVVSPVGFAAPMCMALNTPSVIIHGGAGGWNKPKQIDAPCNTPCTHVLPDSYCDCKIQMCFSCNKTISNRKIQNAIDSILA